MHEITERETLSHVEADILDVLVKDDVLDENGNVDVYKLNALIYDTFSHSYYKVGDKVAKAFSVGTQLMK